MQFNLGIETKVDEQTTFKIRKDLVEELGAMDQTPHINRLKNAIREGALINDFYWENPIAFKTLKKYDVIMAPNCTFYRRDKKSIFAEFCEEIYAARSVVKKEMLGKEQELANIQAEMQKGGLVELKTMAWELESDVARLHNEQHAAKIAMNSLFGALGNRYFREYFDIQIAEAITSVGQNGIRYMSRRLNEWFNMKADTKDVKYSIYNDTDSVYVYIDAWINKMFTPEQQKDVDMVIGWMNKMVAEELEPLLLVWAEELAEALNCPVNKLIFKREALATAGIWVAKKRYALMVSNNEGVQYEKPKLKFTGLEAKKSDYPQFCRDWLKQAYEIALTKTEADLHKLVKQAKEEFMKKPVQDIAGPKSVNNIEKYIDSDGVAAKGTPAQVKAANNYNKMLMQVRSLEKPVVSGDKILIVPLKPGAPLGMETIGFPEYLPEEFDLHRWIDYKSSFEKFFISPLNNYITAVKWAPEPSASVMGFFS